METAVLMTVMMVILIVSLMVAVVHRRGVSERTDCDLSGLQSCREDISKSHQELKRFKELQDTTLDRLRS